MALKICPDCGKKVSSRANQCPDCGCPAEYFEDLKSQAETENSNNNQTESGTPEVSSSADKGTDNGTDIQPTSSIVPTDDSSFTEFKLGGMIFKYNDKVVTEEFRTIYGKYHTFALKAYQKVEEYYNRASDVRTAIYDSAIAGQTLVDEMLKELTKDFYNIGIMTSPEKLKDAYPSYRDNHFDYSKKIQEVLWKLNDVESQETLLAQKRQEEISSRGRWQGGGFGLKGALKGAATAGALNLASDMLHAGSDAKKRSQDNAYINTAKNELYRASKDTVCKPVYDMILFGLYVYIRKANEYGSTYPTEFDKDLYHQQFENALLYETDSTKMQDIISDCLYYCPGDKDMWSEFIPYIIARTTVDESIEFIEYWHLQDAFEYYVKSRRNARTYDHYMHEKGIRDFDFSRVHPGGFFKLKALDDNYASETGEKYLPGPDLSIIRQNVLNYQKITGEHFDSMLSYLHEGIVDWIPQETDSYDFVDQVIKFSYAHIFSNNSPEIERVRLGTNQTRDFVADELKKLFIKGDDGINMFFPTNVLKNWNNGLVLTDKYLILLTKRNLCELSKISNIRVEKNFIDYYTLFVKVGNTEYKESLEDITDIQAKYLLYWLKVFCVRYGKNAALWNEYMIYTPDPSGYNRQPLNLLEALDAKADSSSSTVAESEETSDTQEDDPIIDLTTIRELCKSHSDKQVYGEIGDSLENEKIDTLRENCDVPDSDDVFFVGYMNLIPNGKTGFILSSSGLYSFNKRRIHWNWKKYSEISLTSSNNCIWFDDEKFTPGYKPFHDKLMTVLNLIQEEVKAQLSASKDISADTTTTNIEEIIPEEQTDSTVPESIQPRAESLEEPTKAKTKFCVFCGNKISYEAKFCNYCGKKLP